MDCGGCLSDEVHAAVVISAASRVKGFEYMEVPPFSLCIGTIETNLLILSRLDNEPPEETSRKIWLLARMGFNPSQLQAGFARRREMKHSSITTEQAHALGYMFMKLHKHYGAATMRVGAFPYQMKPQLADDPVSAKVAMLRHKLEKVKKARPNKIGASQAFISDMGN